MPLEVDLLMLGFERDGMYDYALGIHDLEEV